MAGKKGLPKPKGSGMKKGQKIKKTIQWEDWGKAIVEDNMPYLQAELSKIKDSGDFQQFTEHFYKLLEYFKPKLARTEMTGKDGKELPSYQVVIVEENAESKNK